MADRTTKVMNCGQNPKPRLLTIRAPREPRANQMEVSPTVTASPTPNRIRAASQNIGCICGSFLQNFALEGTCFALPPAVQVRFGAPVSATRPILLAAHYNTTRFVFFPQRFCKVFLRFRPFCTSAGPPAHPHASARGRAFVFEPGQRFPGGIANGPVFQYTEGEQETYAGGDALVRRFRRFPPCLKS